MKTHKLIQGSQEWLAYRAEHFNASDAAAMLGISQYETRSALLHRLATGITPEVDAAQQARFDEGHRCEALARPLAEEIVDEELYPVVGSEGKFSASFDGLTMDARICFEHKMLNAALRNVKSMDDLPEQYLPQIEQQLMLSDAIKCLFMASEWTDDNELVDSTHIWVVSNWAMRNRLLQGWTQFAIDLEEYKRKLAAGEIEPPKVEVLAAPVMDLPALSIQVNGSISLITNLQKFGARLNEFVAAINKEPSDDQGFADAEAAIKILQDAQDALEAAESNALAQTSDIDEMRKTVKFYADTARTTRLTLEKMVKARKESIRLEIVQAAGMAFRAHVESLEGETRPIQLAVVCPDFGAAIKGKRTIASLRDAVDTALANGKIAADALAKDIRAKLAWCKEFGTEYGFLFNDLAQIISKPLDDFQLVITSRIAQHKAAEAAKLEAQRIEIQESADRKAKAEVDALIAAERAKMEADERTRVTAMVKAQIEAQAAQRDIEQGKAELEAQQLRAEAKRAEEQLAEQFAKTEVVDSQPQIRAFLDSRDFKDRNAVRAILVEYEKFKQAQQKPGGMI